MCGPPAPPPRPALPPPNLGQQDNGDNGGIRIIDVHAPTAGFGVIFTIFIVAAVLILICCCRRRLLRMLFDGFGYAHQQMTPYAAPYYPQPPIEMRFIGGHNPQAAPAANYMPAANRIQEVPPTPVQREAPLKLEAPTPGREIRM